MNSWDSSYSFVELIEIFVDICDAVGQPGTVSVMCWILIREANVNLNVFSLR